MRNLFQVLRVTARTGKLQERGIASLRQGRPASSGTSRSTAVLEARRAEEVQKCASKGWKSALVCLGNMRKGGVAPGTTAYNVALEACAGAGEWGRAEALLEDMRASGATPDATSFLHVKAPPGSAGKSEPSWGGTASLTAFDDIATSCGTDTILPPTSPASPANNSNSGISGSAGNFNSGGADGPWPSRRSSASEASAVRGGGSGSGRAFASVAGESGRTVSREALPWGIGGDEAMLRAGATSTGRTEGGWGDD